MNASEEEVRRTDTRMSTDWETGKIVSVSRETFAGEMDKHAWVYTIELRERRVSFAHSNKTNMTGFPKYRLFDLGDSVKFRLEKDTQIVVITKDGKEQKLLLKAETWSAQ